MNESEIKQYVRVLRAHWVLIAAVAALCIATAAALAWTREPIYAAHAQLFVSASTDEAPTPSEVYEAGLASEARAHSYARIVSSPPVADAVIQELRIPRSTREVQEAITATVPEETVLIDLTVRDPSPEMARDMANVVASEFPRFVETLEASPAADGSPVEISVTSPAALPASPESPRKGLYLAVGALLGLVLGVGGGVLREVLDRRIRDDDATEAIAGGPVLGHIPHDSRAKERPLVVAAEPDSPQAETYRKLRTNVRVATIDRDKRSLLLTSAVPGEGKTLITANLAFAFAQAGHRVVLVDADLRRPRLSRLLGVEPAPGLSELLAGDVATEPLHCEQELPLEVLASGVPPPNPSELLESEGFAALVERLTSRAEIVLLDSPPLLSASDAAIMAGVTSGVLMVARVASTRAEQLDAAADFLRAVGKSPVGAVLNGLPARISRAYAYGPSDAVEASVPAAPVWER